jgi:hypothetical protein
MTRMTILGVLLIAVEVFAVPSLGQAGLPAVAQAADNAFLITPGVGIGKVKIGMPIAAVISILGAPKTICREVVKDKIIKTYAWAETNDRCVARPDSRGGLLVDTDSGGTVTHVLAYKDDRYFLENGLRIGSEESLVRARMQGEPLTSVGLDGSSHLQYTALGVSFHFRGRNVMAISVSAPDGRR